MVNIKIALLDYSAVHAITCDPLVQQDLEQSLS